MMWLLRSGNLMKLRENCREQKKRNSYSCKIAEFLFISVKTIEAHRSHIMEKLDLHNIADLTRYAIRTGIISSER